MKLFNFKQHILSESITKSEDENPLLLKIRLFNGSIMDFNSYWNDRINKTNKNEEN